MYNHIQRETLYRQRKSVDGKIRICNLVILGNHDYFSLCFVCFIEENVDLFWSVLEVVCVLLQKLSSTYWLLPHNVDSPEQLFDIITQHKCYNEQLQSECTTQLQLHTHDDDTQRFVLKFYTGLV